MKSFILVVSIVLNIIVITAGAYYIVKKGGISYLKHKLGNPESHTIERSASYRAHLSYFDILPKTQGDIIFIGDSITAGCDWAKLFGDIRIRNMGIGMDYTEWLLKRLDQVTILQPSKVFIMIGTADLNNFYVPIPKIISNYTTVIQRLHQESPSTTIYFQTILPKQGYASTYAGLNDDIIELNTRMRELTEQYDFVEYINLYSLFKVDGNQLNPDYTYDGGHLNGKGYLVWKNAIEQYVRQ
jgi:lysophospholipase L1-like esterase